MSCWPFSLSIAVEICRDHTPDITSSPASIRSDPARAGWRVDPAGTSFLEPMIRSKQLTGPTLKAGNNGHTVRDWSLKNIILKQTTMPENWQWHYPIQF
jgi:hypothetical protein